MTKKIIILFISMICILGIIKENVYAYSYGIAGGGSGTLSDFNPEDWEPSSTTSVSGGDKLATIGNNIIRIIKVIGSITSVVTLIVIGIKYILGSVEEKAEYKKILKPYLIGAVMVFAITVFLEIIQNVVGGFF